MMSTQFLRPVLTRAGLLALALAVLPLPIEALDARVEMTDGDLKGIVESGSLVVGSANGEAPTPQDIVAAARADYANILGLLYGEGYYGGTISIKIDGREAADLSPFQIPPKIGTVVVSVDPGQQFKFGKAAVAPLAPDTEIPDGFRTGEPAKARLIQDAVGAAVDGWREIGHAKADSGARRIVARHPQSILDAEVAIVPGPRLNFGRLYVQGNQEVRTSRIQEIAGIRTGKVWTPEDLDAVGRRLRKTGAFKSVSLQEADQPNADGTLDVTLSVVEAPPRRFGFGAEISSTEGLKVSTYWMHRNILHGAERLRFDAEVSGIGGGSGSFKQGGTGMDYTLAATFARPGTWNEANTLTAKAQISQEDEPDYFQRTVLGEVGIERELSQRILITGALQYRYSDVQDAIGDRTFSLLVFPLTGQLDARDVPLNPKAGYFVRLEASPYLGLAGSASGARFYGDGRYYKTFGSDGPVTLAGRLQFGSVVASGITETAPDLLFFSGGGGTVRGQPYESLNVDLGGGVTTGGRSYLGASAEARVRVRGKISLVGFYDFGMIGEDSFPGSNSGSHSGAGLGLRYDTTLGPIRLDVATPVSGSTGEGVQIYVGIGQSF